MNKELIIDVTATNVFIALIEDKQLVELNKDKNNTRFSVGDIYFGKIKKIMPGLNAAFVDIGYEKDAFLHYLDLGAQYKSLNKFTHLIKSNKTRLPDFQTFKSEPDLNKDGKITDVLTSGQNILVQIAKEPISTKGPRLSAEISIAGRNIVLMPFSDKISISQKFKTSEEKLRLKNLLNSITPTNYGVIVRTVAEGKKAAELDLELRSLIEKWEKSIKKIRNANPPKLIMGEINRTSAILRDALNASFNNIYVNDESVYKTLKEYIISIAPERESILKLYNQPQPIFEHFGIEKQIKALFGKTVSIKAGAYLIIEHTEALHVVDVNSGNRANTGVDQEANALEVNLFAVEEIARQLKLRDMGGIIVIDFIDMNKPENKLAVYKKMKDVMEFDKAKHQILPLSKFCLMQITRQRVRPEMNLGKAEACPTCRGTGEIMPSILLTDEIENKLSYLLSKENKGKITITVHPFVASHLTKGIFSIKFKWARKYKKSIKIESNSNFNFLEYEIN
ncbi:MAG: ribonuclease G [Bacteroidetes bacterium GWA2_30_7]|nr:MAG: ribonuclease G [Bacteroidetes bacterium GWA2_30_7]